MIYTNVNEINFTKYQLSKRSEPEKVLMSSPEFFDIIDEKNVYMSGQLGNVSKSKAYAQWEQLRDVYQGLVDRGVLQELSIISGVEGLEDMVFTANQSFPYLVDEKKSVILSKMRHDSRKKEVPFFENFYQQKGYQILENKDISLFEGMGDLIPHIGYNLLYGGYGHRTDAVAYKTISRLLKAPIVALELVNPAFYHLDTCFVPLSQNSVMICPEAFSLEGLKIIEKMFNTVYRIPIAEASRLFSLNAHCIHLNQKVAILQYGSTFTYDALIKEGYEIVEVDTSEFMKSGGSVFCMKMMYY
jgi:N-dimethylarginine dimethylaminohydrolase